MDRQKRAFLRMERYATFAIMTAAFFFLIFLIASGCGVTWLKVICAVFSIMIPLLCAVYLYLVKEWHRRRSQWMVAASLALLICTVLSLLLHFPSPAP